MLPIDTIARYPMIGRFGLLARCMDRLMIADADAERSLNILDAWLATFAPSAEGTPAPYPVWGLPGRDAFEGWLLARLDLLHKLGYAVRLANEEMDGVRGQQHMFVDGRRADLLLRFTADCDKGAADDWLVLENKTTAVGIGALDQLAMSVDWLRAECRPGAVHGMLIADGLSLEVERGLRELRFDYQSMTALGYRRWVRAALAVAPGAAARRRLDDQLPTEPVGRVPWWLRFAERSPYRRRPPPVPHDWRGFLMSVGHLSWWIIHIRICRSAGAFLA